MGDIAIGRGRPGMTAADAAAPDATAPGRAAASCSCALAAIWLLDGVLQYQSFMFTKAFVQMIGQHVGR